MKYTITSVSNKTLTIAEKPYDDAADAMAEFVRQITDPETVDEYDMVRLMEKQEEGFVILAACAFTDAYKDAVKCTVKH